MNKNYISIIILLLLCSVKIYSQDYIITAISLNKVDEKQYSIDSLTIVFKYNFKRDIRDLKTRNLPEETEKELLSEIKKSGIEKTSNEYYLDGRLTRVVNHKNEYSNSIRDYIYNTSGKLSMIIDIKKLDTVVNIIRYDSLLRPVKVIELNEGNEIEKEIADYSKKGIVTITHNHKNGVISKNSKNLQEELSKKSSKKREIVRKKREGNSGSELLLVLKIDKNNNWIKRKTYQIKNEKRELISTSKRIIYYNN
ncbi:hypothetical protein [Saccharicrinis sp. FJH54]|uniref:hypothetical protein n=1 Tax=Saccharicrinis sp. FJH54 TaxID=3344665 RepID=UPI0035D48585